MNLDPVFPRAARRLAAAFLFAAPMLLQAAPFARRIEYTQPGGATITLWGQGDEYAAFFETLDGQAVVHDAARGGYCYATLSTDGSALVSTGVLVGEGASPEPRLHLRPSREGLRRQIDERRQHWDPDGHRAARWESLKRDFASIRNPGAFPELMAPPNAPTLGTKVGITLLIDFADANATVTTNNIRNFCNGDTPNAMGNNGSVKHYFQDCSAGRLVYTNVVTPYIRVTVHPKSWYNDTSKDCGTQGNLLIRDAIAAMKARADYATVILPQMQNATKDGNGRAIAFNVFYAGGNGGVWAKGLWPHSWSLYEVGEQTLGAGLKAWDYQLTDIGSTLELGTFCHENGHMLCGYPDIYDYDYDSIGGAGIFCLMDYGGGGNNPVRICAYLRYASGWCETIEVTSNSYINGAAVRSAPTNIAGYTDTLYRFAKPGTPTEYYLIENRQKTGRDSSLPAAGIAVWHVDELGDHDNQNLAYNSAHRNYEVTLVQADNRWDFQNNRNSGDARDLYYLGNTATGYSNRLNDITTPAARWWNGSFSGMHLADFSASATQMTFNIIGSGDPKAVILTPPASRLVSLGSNTVFDVLATGLPPLRYRWRRDGAPLADDGRIVGSGTNRLTIAAVTNSDQAVYDVIVSNAYGRVTSAPPAQLTVVSVPLILGHPTNLTVINGDAAQFLVSAVGPPPLAYQWQREGAALSNGTSAVLTLYNAVTNDSGSYRAVISNQYGAATSVAAQLAVIPGISLGEALDAPQLAWSVTGTRAWEGQRNITHDDLDAAASGTISNLQYSGVSTVVTGPALVTFWWKVSSEQNWDWLLLQVGTGTQPVRKITGQMASWEQSRAYVPPGPQRVEWRYVKDSNDTIQVGLDRGWLDQVLVQPTDELTLPKALDATNLPWTTGGTTSWVPQIDYTYDDHDAGQTGVMGNNATSWVQTTVTGPGVLVFQWMTSCEYMFDRLVLWLNGVSNSMISGESPWVPETRLVGAGENVCRWAFSRDGYGGEGLDAAFLDQVHFYPAAAPPEVLTQPLGTTTEVGYAVTLSAWAAGPGTLTYQWLQNGSPVPGAFSNVYNIASAQESHSGDWELVVANGNGSATSVVAKVLILPPITFPEAVDSPGLVWSNSGAANWDGQNRQTHDGTDAAQSGPISDGQTTSVSTVLSGPGTLSFYWKVSSEEGYDWLALYVGGALQSRISGVTAWQPVHITLPPGPQQVRWTFSKDFSVGFGVDSAWLDEIVFVQAPPPDIVGLGQAEGIMQVQVDTVSGLFYQLEESQSTTLTNWTGGASLYGDGTRQALPASMTNRWNLFRVRMQ